MDSKRRSASHVCAHDPPPRPAGRILINAPLVKNMKPITNPKTPRNIVMLLFSSVDGSEERSSNLFKCESPEAMQALLAVITENV